MTEHTLTEIAEAEIVPNQGGPDTYLLRFGEDEYDLVSKTPRTELALETDIFEQAQKHNGYRLTDDDGNIVVFKATDGGDTLKLSADGDQVILTGEYESAALNALVEDDVAGLRDIHEEIMQNRVRRGLMDQFIPRFNTKRATRTSTDTVQNVEKLEEGYLVKGTFVVDWTAENYIAENTNAYRVSGGEAVLADDTKQARVLDFDLDGSAVVESPNGREYELTERELEFLATIEVLINHDEYLTNEESDRIQELIDWNDDPIGAAASRARVSAFTDEKSGLHHAHGIQKHTLSDLNVTDEAIERLHYNAYDHTGVHELALRKEEFQNAPFDVFENTHDYDTSKWSKIESTRKNAPIPQETRNELEAMYE